MAGELEQDSSNSKNVRVVIKMLQGEKASFLVILV